MDLAHPGYLWLLSLVPLLSAWIALGRRRRARDWRALGQGGRLPVDGANGWLGAIACLIVALAQPRWGRSQAPPLPPGRDVVLLVDNSRSMGAEDAVPNRLGVAVEAAESLVAALGREPGNRVAVVAFAGRGVVRCPLTENLGAVVGTLQSLRPGDVRPGGTDLGAALATAVDAFGNEDHAGGRTIVLFSDGEDHAGSWEGSIDRLRAAGIVVHAVAVGDAEHDHPVPSGQGPGTGTLTYQGAAVLSRRSDLPLSALAQATGGAVVPLGLAAVDLGPLYLNRIEPVARQKRLVFRPSERAERFPWFVLAAVAMGLGGSWPWGWRRAGVRPRRLAPWVLAIVSVGLATGATRGESSADRLVDEGRIAYRAGRWAEALTAFERAGAIDPGAAIPRYDAAATLFQLGRFAEARDRYRAARERSDPGLRTRIDYALGNTDLALGDIAGAIRDYDNCLASAAWGQGLDAVRHDAAINRRFAQEAARRSPTPPKPDDGSFPRPRPRSSPPKSKGGGSSEPNPARPGPSRPEVGAGSRGGGDHGPRGAGGAGGSGPAPDQDGSAESRLDVAVERVREARRHRLPEPPPPISAGDHKDW